MLDLSVEVSPLITLRPQARVLFVALLGAALCLIGLGAAPDAEADGLHAPVEPLLAEQPLAAQQQHISSLIGQDPTDAEAISVVADHLFEIGRDNGYAGLRVDEDTRSIALYWKGEAPSEVREYIGSQPLDVAIELTEHARYSRSEARDIAYRVAHDPTVVAQRAVVGVSVNHNGSGVTVRTNGPGPSSTLKRTIGRAARTDGAITYRQTSDTRPAPQSRQNDSPPWKGGIRTKSGSALCSTAFAVLRGSTGLVLTAHHCDPTANKAVTDGAGQTIAPGGASVSSVPSIDSQLLDPSASPATTGKIYTGAYNSNTRASVKGWAKNYIGNTVCNNGATSGTRCGKVTDDADTIPGLSGSFYIRATATSGWMSAGGDSGGPWTAATSGGVIARGVHWGGGTQVTCGNIDPKADTTCSKNSWYVPISVILNTWGVSLETT